MSRVGEPRRRGVGAAWAAAWAQRGPRATGSGALAGIAVGLSSGDWRARACLARWEAR